MGNHIQIAFPRRHEVLHTPFFIAFGEGFAGSQVAGILLGGRGRRIPGQTLASGEYWAVAFDHVPRGRYELLVFDTGQTIPVARRRFRVTMRQYDVSMTFPTGGPVPNGFVAQGSVSAGVTSVSGSLVGSDSVSIAGNVLRQPSPGSPGWGIQFNVPKPYHNPYNLTITGSDGSHAYANGLNVQG